ncbi:hypothetical protein SAMN05518672_1011597 [Chitinophaga sp. CF118]|uniref:hypothetical protein n=1 Tax=Chitinophaga sp. CF118 TaxID=1884367 RepID=UPI0008E5C5C7|nr:hypothetical protein [Chitinophaga sp. CF118]SFD31788.1 hypothetical protein SAMN05518672_1011597 [Chitinophaga sp. CF118]
MNLKPRISGISQPGKQAYIYNMLKYGIIAFFVVLTFAIGVYFFLAYRLDTIIVYDREAAYINVGNHLSVKPEFMINKNKELRVFLDFQNVHETAMIQHLNVKISSSRKESPLLSVSTNINDNNAYALTFPQLPESCKLVHPVYPSSSGTITFAFDTHNISSSNYFVTIEGSILTNPNQPPTSFSKEIDIEKETVLSERTRLF